jgi:hypothetical protein
MESLAKEQRNRALGPMDQAESISMRWKENLLPGDLAVAPEHFRFTSIHQQSMEGGFFMRKSHFVAWIL